MNGRRWVRGRIICKGDMESIDMVTRFGNIEEEERYNIQG